MACEQLNIAGETLSVRTPFESACGLHDCVLCPIDTGAWRWLGALAPPYRLPQYSRTEIAAAGAWIAATRPQALVVLHDAQARATYLTHVLEYVQSVYPVALHRIAPLPSATGGLAARVAPIARLQACSWVFGQARHLVVLRRELALGARSECSPATW